MDNLVRIAAADFKRLSEKLLARFICFYHVSAHDACAMQTVVFQKCGNVLFPVVGDDVNRQGAFFKEGLYVPKAGELDQNLWARARKASRSIFTS